MATVGVEAFGDVLLLSAQLTPTEGLRRPDGWNGTTMPESAVPVRVRQEADALYCRRLADGAPIRYLTFEREGEHSAYGVYGLMGEKNDLPVDYPLRGHPIAWPDLDHEGAMLRQLGMHGVEAAAARELVATRGADWFGEGLRVFFFLDSRAAASFAPVAEARPPRAVLIRVELSSD